MPSSFVPIGHAGVVVPVRVEGEDKYKTSQILYFGGLIPFALGSYLRQTTNEVLVLTVSTTEEEGSRPSYTWQLQNPSLPSADKPISR